jgi:UDP-glucose 4-epimerase
VEALRAVTGKDLHVTHGLARMGDIKFSYGDASKAADGLGFKANVDMQEGLRSLFEDVKGDFVSDAR